MAHYRIQQPILKTMSVAEMDNENNGVTADEREKDLKI